MILSPEIILADEPAERRRPRGGRSGCAALLIELNRMGKTVLVATHDRTLARSLAVRAPARLLTLADGRVEAAEAGGVTAPGCSARRPGRRPGCCNRDGR